MSQITRVDVAVTISPVETTDGALVHPRRAILSNLPPGAVPSAGFPCGAGEWLLVGRDFDGLTISVPDVHADRLRPDIRAIHDAEGAVADCPGLGPAEPLPEALAARGPAAPGRAIPLDLSAVLAGHGGGEVYDVTVTGLPAGARLSAGIGNGNETWTLLPDHFDDAGLVVPDGFSGCMTLAYCTTSVGPHGELRRHNAFSDFSIEAEAEPGISFGPGRGRAHFVGHGGERDVVRLAGVEGGPSDEIAGSRDWKLVLDDARQAAKPLGSGLRFSPEASGLVVLGDGNALSFVHVAGIDW